MASNRSATVLVAIACVLGGGATSAWAKKRVVMLNFTGHEGKKAQAALVAKMKRKYTMVPQAAFQKTAKQLRIKRPNDDDVANIARKLRADAVVVGQVKKSGKSYDLTVTVRDGASGRAERVTIPLKGGKVDSKAIAQLDSEVLPLIERAEGGGAALAASPATDTDNPLERRTTSRSTTPDPPARAVAADEPASAAMGGSRGASSEDRAETEVSRAGGARPWWRPIATAAVDFGGIGRNLSMDGSAIQGYSGSLVASLGLGVGLYPMAGSSGSLRGLGLYASYDKVVSVSSTLSCGTQSQSLDSAQQALTFGAEYGYRLHETEDAMTIGGRLGYGLTSFEVTVPANACATVTVPDVSYKYLDVGPFVKVPFHTNWELSLRASYLPVFDNGQIGSGGRMGTIMRNGSTTGLEAALGLSWRYRPWLDLLLASKLDRFSTSFDSGAAITGASDLFYTVALGAGVVY